MRARLTVILHVSGHVCESTAESVAGNLNITFHVMQDKTALTWTALSSVYCPVMWSIKGYKTDFW